MLRLLLLFVLLGGLSCSKDRPPTAPAGKKNCALCDILGDGIHQAPDGSEGDTAPDSSVVSPPAAVAIPDAALRRYLEKVLKKHRGATITQADMNTLVSLLDGHGLGIKSLVGLEAATNLQHVAMGGNAISDLTPLANLPKLRYLYIRGNPLRDAAINEQIPALERRGVVVFPSYLSPPDTVLILDVTLRTSIEVALKKQPRQPITQVEMETLTYLAVLPFHVDGLKAKSLIGLEAATNLQTLDLRDNAISDVTPLANLPKLQTLELYGNAVSDVTPLANLPKLQTLNLYGNAVSDVTPLANLPKLQTLELYGNAVSDVTPLANLPKLQTLGLQGNAVSDVTPLADLPNLQTLGLQGNAVSDLTPLANLPKLRYLDLQGNPLLNDVSIDEHIPALQHRGVKVVLSPYHRTFPDSPFDIDLVFLGGFTGQEKDILRHAANRWEAAIQADIPDFIYPASIAADCGDHSVTISAGERVDDIRIHLTKKSLRAAGGVFYYKTSENRNTGTFVDFRCIIIHSEYTHFEDIWYIGLHEIGHALGVVPSSYPPHADLLSRGSRRLRNRKTADDHFAGPQAIAAFNQAGGSDYQGPKVPTHQGGNHWHADVLSGELMAPHGWDLSAITLGALSDLGYTVDFSAADPYELPPPGAAKPVADAVPFFCSVERLPAPVYVDD